MKPVPGACRSAGSTASTTSSAEGTPVAPGVSDQRQSSEPESTRERQPRAGRGPQLVVVAAGDGGEVADGQLVQGRVPGEVLALVDDLPVAGDPLVHPAEPGPVVAGLVVGVRPRVRGVTTGRLDRQRGAGQVHRLVEAALLLAHEREQPGVPPVVAVGRRGPLDDLPGLRGHGGGAGERDRRHRDAEQQGVRRASARGGAAAARSRRARAGRRRARGCARAACCAGRAGGPRRAVARRRPARRTRDPSRASAAWPRAKVGSSATARDTASSAPPCRRRSAPTPTL